MITLLEAILLITIVSLVLIALVLWQLKSRPAPQADLSTEASAIARRSDPRRVPGSRHFASMLAYGHFKLAGGPTITCDGIPGISGVETLPNIETQKGKPTARLRRLLTHFHFDNPQIVIEQNPSRESVGELVGAGAELLPGRASFSQYLILTLQDRPLANRQPLVMTADRVDQWPPVGSAFVLEEPTDFYDLKELDNPVANPIATLAACKGIISSELTFPLR